MSAGILILILVAAAALYFLGGGRFILTLANPRESRFTRSVSGAETRFDVTPARPSWAALLVALLGLWVLSLDFLGFPRVLGAIPLIMGLVALPIGARHRRPTTITVSAQGLRNERGAWALDEIAEIGVQRGSSINTKEPDQLVIFEPGGGMSYAPKPSAAMFSRALNRRAVERSWRVGLRTRSGSAVTTLSGGLTRATADALRTDLTQAIDGYRA